MSGEPEEANEPPDIDRRTESEKIERSTDGSASPPSTAVVFDILANKRRRHVLRVLRTYETPIALADLADEVAIEEHESSLTEIPAEDVKRVYISLWHSHVPKLDDADVIEYEQDRDTVTVAKNIELLEPYLERAIAE